MAVSAPALSEALAEIVGRQHCSSDPSLLAAHTVDGVAPRWVVRPSTVEQVSRLLALASVERLAVSPQGSRSSLGLGNPPRRLDLALDLGRLDALAEYAPEDMVASVEAGLTLTKLAARLEERGQMLAIDPLGGCTRTVGGVLACHASGPLRFRYRTGRDLALGLRFVQADGTLTWGGAKVVKSVTGYDVPKLLVGSLGTLGVIVGATFRLHPIPPSSGSWICSFGSREAAGDFLAALFDSTLEPDRVALLNGSARHACGLGGDGLAALVSVGSVEEAVASHGAALGRMAKARGASVRAVSVSIWEALGRAVAGPVLLKVACEPRRAIFWLGEMERRASSAGCALSAVAQAGNGVIHLSLEGPLDASSVKRDVILPSREGLSAEGGSVVVERAPADVKAGLDVWGPIAPEVFAVMRRLKQEFDPQGILSPGRFVGGL